MANDYKILLVEDEDKLAQVIQDELIRHGFPTDIAADGLEATRLFRQYSYSLVLLDINLPYKNGFVL